MWAFSVSCSGCCLDSASLMVCMGPNSLGGSNPGLSEDESMSYTDMKDGMWFSYILGPAADGILEF